MFKDAYGMWYNDRYKPYISMAVDLVLDLLLIQFIGLKGAIISSIICVCFIEIPWETHVLFKCYFHGGIIRYLQEMAGYLLFNLILVVLSSLLLASFVPADTILSLIVRFALCTLFYVFTAFLVFRKGRVYQTWYETTITLLKKRKTFGR